MIHQVLTPVIGYSETGKNKGHSQVSVICLMSTSNVACESESQRKVSLTKINRILNSPLCD